jgi:hypothetical protein
LPAGLLGGCTSVLTEGTAAGAGISRAVTRNAGATTGIGQAAARAGLQTPNAVSTKPSKTPSHPKSPPWRREGIARGSSITQFQSAMSTAKSG